jgi:hypothetical protein
MGAPYRQLLLRAVQLSSEVYSSCGGEGFRRNVLYRRHSLNFQYTDRVKPLEILTCLCVYLYSAGLLSSVMVFGFFHRKVHCLRCVAADFKEYISLFFTPQLKLCEEFVKVRLLFQA